MAASSSTSKDNSMTPFRQFLDSRSPFLPGIQGQDASTHADHVLERLPPIRTILTGWDKLWREPFKGITTDGNIRDALFERTDDSIPVEEIVKAAHAVIATLSEQQREVVLLPFDAKERRAWQNTHLYFYRHGMRLDGVDDQIQSLVLKLLETVMSPKGYQKAIITTETNAFLGQLYHGQGVLNRYSYNFALFGEPSSSQPWAFSLFGHHLCLNIFIYGDHIEITPTLMGAEPNEIDEGPLAGTKLFVPEQDLGLSFMHGLSSELQRKARLRESMDPTSGTKGTHTWAACGAFVDSRIIPLEGLCLAESSQASKDLVLKIVEHFILYLPAEARQRKIREVAKYINEMWFGWIGGLTDADPFYYRLQSPVIICEFEHCASIFLGNTKPERFHIHTLVRTPNAGDYGQALLDAHNCVEMGELES